nr:NADH dehydrogenase subunit 2 [Raymondia sp. A GC-2023a]
MFNNTSKLLFLLIMIISSMISMSANSWLNAWMGLEINLLSFIPLMKNNKLMSSEASLKYFLTQALASSSFLLSMMLMMMNNFMTFKLMMMFSLMMKLGAAPFHMWFINVMEGLSWNNSMILMTWQKLTPLILLSNITNKLMIINIIMSTTIGAIGGLNQTSIRKLMAYSSINNLSWMLLALLYSNLMMIIYFMFYTFISISLMTLFNMIKISHLNQINMMFYNKFYKMFLMINIISLAGLPPFMGFFPKWMIIQSSIYNNQMTLILLNIMMSLITIHFYLRMCYSFLMINNFEMKINNTTNFNNTYMYSLMLYSTMNLTGLLMISMYYNF